MTKSEHTDFVITTDENGIQHAVNEQLQVSVLPDAKARLFHRREIRPFAGGQKRSALVAELDGVRVFIQGSHIVVTKRNLPLFGEKV